MDMYTPSTCTVPVQPVGTGSCLMIGCHPEQRPLSADRTSHGPRCAVAWHAGTSSWRWLLTPPCGNCIVCVERGQWYTSIHNLWLDQTFCRLSNRWDKKKRGQRHGGGGRGWQMLPSVIWDKTICLSVRRSIRYEDIPLPHIWYLWHVFSSPPPPPPQQPFSGLAGHFTTSNQTSWHHPWEEIQLSQHFIHFYRIKLIVPFINNAGHVWLSITK